MGELKSEEGFVFKINHLQQQSTTFNNIQPSSTTINHLQQHSTIFNNN